MIHNGMRPVHPGEILREEFMAPFACRCWSVYTAP